MTMRQPARRMDDINKYFTSGQLNNNIKRMEGTAG